MVLVMTRSCTACLQKQETISATFAETVPANDAILEIMLDPYSGNEVPRVKSFIWDSCNENIEYTRHKLRKNSRSCLLQDLFFLVGYTRNLSCKNQNAEQIFCFTHNHIH